MKYLLSFKKSKLIKENVVNAKDEEEKTLNKLVGKVGTALTDLDSEGKIQVNGVTLNAVTNGEDIEKNSQVKIIKIDGIKIIVKKVDIDVE